MDAHPATVRDRVQCLPPTGRGPWSARAIPTNEDMIRMAPLPRPLFGVDGVPVKVNRHQPLQSFLQQLIVWGGLTGYRRT